MEERKNRRAHCLVLVFPTQGHINPILQFAKRLDHKGVRVTVAATRFVCNFIHNKESIFNFALESFSDGFDNGGVVEAESDTAYIDRSWEIGPKTFANLLERLMISGDLVDCVVYDSFMPWALEVAKRFGVKGAVFFTQSCVVNSIYYHAYHGNLKFPVTDDEAQISLPALPTLSPYDLPSFFYVLGAYPGYTRMLVNQFSNKADWVLCNSFYELEPEVVDWQAKILPLKTIGPTIPSMFLDKRLQDDRAYGLNIFKTNDIEACMKWLSDKPSWSVVYVSFGSLAALNAEQMEELAWGLKDSGMYFLWVVRESKNPKLPKGFLEISENKGLVVTWSPQLQVLEHEAVGCFVTHCGWNSTMEAVSLGIPMVAIPQWTDQPTNAKCIMDVWKMGLKAQTDEKGVVRRETVMKCIKEVMESERGQEMKRNAIKWKTLAAKAFDEGGSSDKNIEDFVVSLVPSACNE